MCIISNYIHKVAEEMKHNKAFEPTDNPFFSIVEKLSMANTTIETTG